MGCWRRLKHFNDFGSFVCILIVHSCEVVQCNAIMNLQRLSSSSSSYKRTPQPYLSVLFTPTSNTTPFPNPKLKASIKSPICISTQIFQYPQTFAHFSPSRPSRWNPTLPLQHKVSTRSTRGEFSALIALQGLQGSAHPPLLLQTVATTPNYVWKHG